MALARLPINDTSLGVVREAREKIPQRGLYRLENGLLDGFDVYRRGGLKRLHTTDFGTDRLTFAWTGKLADGWRTLFANPYKFATLGVDGEPVDLGLTGEGAGGLSHPVRAHGLGRFLVLDGGLMWAGARLAGLSFDAFSFASVTHNSKIVTGTGFSANVDRGSIFRVAGSTRHYIVDSVESNTQLTLSEVFAGGTDANAVFEVRALTQAPYVAPIYAVVGKRLAACERDTLHFSDYGDLQTFQDDNNHVMPGSVEIRGADAIGDSAAVFTSDGLWVIDNFSLEPVDDFGNIQHTLRHIVEGLILWHRAGIGHYAGALIVPALDGIWLVTDGQPQRIDRQLGSLVADYVEDGCTPGLAAVHRSKYILPILRGTEMIDQMVCHLDQPDQPWTFFSGKSVFALSSSSERDTLVAATESPRLYEARYLNPGSDVPDDDGTPYSLDLITRDYPTGNGNKNLVRHFDVDYQLVDTNEGDNPTLEVSYSDGSLTGAAFWGQFDWGEADWSNADTAGFVVSDTLLAERTSPDQSRVDLEGEQRRARYIRFRVRSSGRIATLVIRTLAFWVRQSTKAD